jgi:hypothetical protein
MADFTYSRNSDEMATECGVHNEQQGAKMEVCVLYNCRSAYKSRMYYNDWLTHSQLSSYLIDNSI